MDEISDVESSAFLRRVAAAVSEVLSRAGIGGEAGKAMTGALIAQLQQKFGGTRCYFKVDAQRVTHIGENEGLVVEIMKFIDSQLNALMLEAGVWEEEAAETARRCVDAVRQFIRQEYLYIPHRALSGKSGFKRHIDISREGLLEGISLTIYEELLKTGLAENVVSAVQQTCSDQINARFGGSQTYVRYRVRNAGRRTKVDLLQFIADGLAELIGAHGFEPTEAREIAGKCSDAVWRFIGGGRVYIPKGPSSRNEERDACIVSEFNGANYYALSRKHELSEMRIRQIISAHRARRRASN